ncbi:hypothetical protein [Candidatus Accumulibacter vicinus]|uniref:Cbb3-type cytochrome c oxidase subunit 3 n=1 Tax=Candidatus Accumulibacter vicinus TaxID=2954382 RepID=A0A084XZK1_9PROT|nr:hypothetical protein [Candidatus Accumulibacter vicinus]KFB67895.1 MAG: hypothetical protein CAPSK01_002483 [Candidatus Accumulibacter vicinus]
MDSGLLASLDWGTFTLLAVIAAALVWGMVFFLRQNRKDLDDLQEALDLQSEEDDDEDEKMPDSRASHRRGMGS